MLRLRPVLIHASSRNRTVGAAFIASFRLLNQQSARPSFEMSKFYEGLFNIPACLIEMNSNNDFVCDQMNRYKTSLEPWRSNDR